MTFVAGFVIGLGCLISNLIAQPLVGYCCFAVGLMYIRVARLPLVTGMTQRLGDDVRFSDWCKVLIGNVCGAFAAALVSVLLLKTQGNAAVWEKVNMMASAKLVETNWAALLWQGVCCGALMTIATYKEMPLYVSVLCVVAFLAAGFNHCVADSFYLLMVCGNWQAWAKFAVVVIGNLIGGYVIKKRG